MIEIEAEGEMAVLKNVGHPTLLLGGADDRLRRSTPWSDN